MQARCSCFIIYYPSLCENWLSGSLKQQKEVTQDIQNATSKISEILDVAGASRNCAPKGWSLLQDSPAWHSQGPSCRPICIKRKRKKSGA